MSTVDNERYWLKRHEALQGSLESVGVRFVRGDEPATVRA